MNEKDARFTRSRLALIQSGMVMLTENRSATLSEIAQIAGVGRATLYRHFEAKEQLVVAIAHECIADFDKATTHIEKEATSWLHAIEMMFAAVIPLEKQLTFLMNLEALTETDEELQELCEGQQKELLELVEGCQKEKSIKADISPDWVIALIEGLFFTAWQMVSKKSASHQEAAEFAFETLCHGIKR